jgi:hypothetical protein
LAEVPQFTVTDTSSTIFRLLVLQSSSSSSNDKWHQSNREDDPMEYSITSNNSMTEIRVHDLEIGTRNDGKGFIDLIVIDIFRNKNNLWYNEGKASEQHTRTLDFDNCIHLFFFFETKTIRVAPSNKQEELKERCHYLVFKKRDNAFPH